MIKTDTKTLYKGKDALPLIVIDTGDMYAVIAMQGAQILEFKVKGQDMLWLSPLAQFEKGKSIRGGIPICAPWFGISTDPAKVKHGFVRTQDWSLTHSEETAEVVILVFAYQHKGDVVFQYPFKMTYTMRFAEDLQLDLKIENQSNEPMPFSWAFHSYHPVEDLAAVRVRGLENIEYLDATHNFKPIKQNGLIHFDGEVDRVYENVPREQMILQKCSLHIEGYNCPTAIVWNPGAVLAAKMPDVEQGYAGYICVERGAAFGDSWNLSSREIKAAKLTISIRE